MRQPGAALRPPGAALRQPGAALRPPGAALRQPGAALRPPGVIWLARKLLDVDPDSALSPVLNDTNGRRSGESALNAITFVSFVTVS